MSARLGSGIGVPRGFGALAQRWQAMSGRERRMVSIATVVLAVGLVWGLLIDPALSARARLARELPELRTQLGQMDTLSAEAKRLGSARGARIPPAQVRDELERSAGAAGLRGNLAKVQAEGGRIEMQFDDVPFGTWLGWLDGVQRTLRLRVAQVAVSRTGAGGQASGPPPVALGQPPAAAPGGNGRVRASVTFDAAEPGPDGAPK
mgnify:CR=1 FL=1